jgi:DNA processing protein
MTVAAGPDPARRRSDVAACGDCLRRTALIAALAGRLDVEWRRREAPGRVLALSDDALLDIADRPAVRAYARFKAAPARAAIDAAGLVTICRCEDGYPERLRALPDPPAVLHVAGRAEALRDPDAVAIVGARRATPYGLEVSRTLGRELAAAGVPVVSGMALGIDAAAHVGALESEAAPVAVLAGAAEVAYPARHRLLHEQIAERGCVVSEMPPGFTAFRWSFVARNRIIAALAAVTVVVEAAERSGSLTTADFAADIGRTVAAVPGRVTCRTAAGANELLHSGAALVRHSADLLDLLAEATGSERRPAPKPQAAALEPELRRVLTAIESGRTTLGALASTPEEARAVLAALGELEFRGLVRRGFSGRYEPAA